MNKLKKSVSTLTVNIILLFLVFIIGEGVCRVAGIPYKMYWIPNENSFGRFDYNLGWSYIPNKSTISIVGGSENPIKKLVHFDENGIRISHPGFQFDYSRPTVMFIGCSLTMGHGLSYEETFVGKFASNNEVPYQVVNLGVQGYGTDQALLALKKYINKFNTKVVVYTFHRKHIRRNGNYDRRQLISGAKFLGTKPQFALSSEKELYLARKPMLYKDYDYSHSWLLDLYRIKVGDILGTFPPMPIDLTKAIIQDMKKISNENGAHFIILNWEWTAADDNDELLNDLDVDIIDTIKEAPNGWDKMVILGGAHPNTQAGNHAAWLLYKYFHRKGLILSEIEK